MKSNAPAKFVAALSLVLLLGFPFTWIGIAIGMFQTFSDMSGDVAHATGQVTGGVIVAMRSVIIGQSIGAVGFLLLLVSIFGLRIREPWLLFWGRILMYPSLVVVPFGTAGGILMLIYFSRHQDEFGTRKGADPNVT